jgi:DNA-binding LacI/PurR family transcriptional regulator
VGIDKSRNKSSTIKMVAAMAGVSEATVSRVMNRPESVSIEKRNRVQEAIQSLDYSPSPLARGLAMDSLGLVGIIVPNITNQANARIVYGAMDILEKEGFGILLFDAREDLDKEIGIYSSLPKKMLDGVIVIFGNGSMDDYSELGNDLPVVLAGPPNMDLSLDQLTTNELLGFQDLIQYLHGFGHRDIGILYGSEDTSGGRRRKDLFSKAMADFGLQVKPQFMKSCEWTMEGGYQGAKELFAESSRPSALLGASDQIAIGAMRSLGEMGYSIPRDVSVVGFDNSPISRYVTPSLSTLDFPHTQMGEAAAELLVRKIRKPELSAVRKVLPLEIIPRDSVGPVEDSSVVFA